MKQKFLKEDHIMIKNFAKPFNVVCRTENSLNKKIESIKDQIEFEKYKLRNNSIETSLFTQEEIKGRIDKLEQELEYYQEIIRLKWDEKYINGIFGGEFIVIGTWVGAIALGKAIGLGVKKLRK